MAASRLPIAFLQPEPCYRSSGASTSHAPLAPSGLEARTGAFHDQLSLHLGQTGHHVEKEAPCGRLGIDAVSDTLEMYLLGFKFIDQVHQSFHAAPEPIQFPDHEGVGWRSWDRASFSPGRSTCAPLSLSVKMRLHPVFLSASRSEQSGRRDQVNPPLAAGEIVTTGTLTRALPVSAGETWTTQITGVGLDGICVRFA